MYRLHEADRGVLVFGPVEDFERLVQRSSAAADVAATEDQGGQRELGHADVAVPFAQLLLADPHHGPNEVFGLVQPLGTWLVGPKGEGPGEIQHDDRRSQIVRPVLGFPQLQRFAVEGFRLRKPTLVLPQPSQVKKAGGDIFVPLAQGFSEF